MTGTKLLLFGFLLVLVGISLLAILSIPNAPFILEGIFTNAPVTSAAQTFAQLDAQAVEGYATTIHILGGIAFVLLVAGLVSAAIGLLRKG
jgi:hypothetical protein